MINLLNVTKMVLFREGKSLPPLETKLQCSQYNPHIAVVQLFSPGRR